VKNKNDFGGLHALKLAVQTPIPGYDDYITLRRVADEGVRHVEFQFTDSDELLLCTCWQSRRRFKVCSIHWGSKLPSLSRGVATSIWPSSVCRVLLV
jgi:hypothetical protein